MTKHIKIYAHVRKISYQLFLNTFNRKIVIILSDDGSSFFMTEQQANPESYHEDKYVARYVEEYVDEEYLDENQVYINHFPSHFLKMYCLDFSFHKSKMVF